MQQPPPMSFAPFPPGVVPPPPIMVPVPPLGPPMTSITSLTAQPPPLRIPMGTNMLTQVVSSLPTAATGGLAAVSLALSSNPHASIPLTLYIGKIPRTLEDETLKKILEACGKINKWMRGIDNINALRNFGFVTYDSGLGALRCYSILGGLDFNGSNVILKAGSKELVALGSLIETEQMAIAAQAEEVDMNMQIINKISLILDKPPSLDIPVPDHPLLQFDISDSKNVSLIPSSSLGTLSNVLVENEEFDPLSSTVVVSEIEKFRTRALIRDKELAEQKKFRSEQKAMQIHVEADARDAENASKSASDQSKFISPRAGDDPQNKKRLSEDAISNEDENEKRRRRQEVLERLTGESAAAATEDNALKEAYAKGGGASFIKVKGSVKKNVTKSAAFSTVDDEDEEKVVRQVVPIDYTEEEIAAGRMPERKMDEIDKLKEKALLISKSLSRG